MNKNLQTKLKRYSLAATAIGAVGANAEAQVTEYPLSISISTFGSNSDFDLDGDGTDDIKLELRAWGTSGGAAYITPLNGNSVLGYKLTSSFQGLSYNPTALSTGAPIDANQSTWVGSGSSMALAASYGYGGYGPFNNKTNVLVGVAIDNGAAGTQYGWIRMSTVMNPSARSISISHLALADDVNYGIAAGQTTVTGTQDDLEQSTAVSINGANEVSVKSASESGTVTITDLSGRTVASTEIENGSASVSVDAASGLYVVKVATASGAVTKKVYVN